MSQTHKSAGVIFDAAVELPVEQRAAYVQEACAGDEPLRLRVEALLRAHDAAGTFMAGPAADRLPPTVVANSPPTEKPGHRIGRYKLLQQIGEGGCGVVYMAEQEEPVKRRVALKVIKLGMDTKSVIARFEAERQALALMDHPNIAKVLDAGATDTGRPYFVMELVRGIKITEYCDQHNLSTQARLDLFVQTCRAVQHAHQKGVIHRDIKPSNILVTHNDGVPMPKVIDFGIAKAAQGKLTDQTLFTAFEQFIGTPAYMSPEQAEMSALDIDTRSDIYSLGVLLYELLTGKTPFDATELLQAGLDEMRRQIREKEPAKPSTRLSTMLAVDLTSVAAHRQAQAPKLIHLVRGELDWIVMKCLEKDRMRRYDTANDLASDIQRHLNKEPVAAGPPSGVYRARKFVQRHRVGVTAVSLVLLALVAGILGTTLSLMEALRQKREATRKGAIARETTAFFTNMFTSINPAAAKLREVTVREILDKAAEKLGKAFPNEPLTELPIRWTLSTVYAELGRDGEALTNADLAYRLATRAYGGRDAPAVAQTLVNLAERQDQEGRTGEALQRAKEALAMLQRLEPGESANVARAMQCVANRLWSSRRYPEALRYHESALGIWGRVKIGDDEAKAEGLLGNAWCLDALNRRVEGLAKHEEALAMWQRLRPGDDPEVALNLEAVGFCLDQLGRSAEALPKLEAALQMLRRIFRSDHPYLARNLNNVGLCLEHLGRDSEALTNFEAVVAMSKRMYPGGNPATVLALDNLAECLGLLGRYGEALPRHQEALAMGEKVDGDESRVAKYQYHLAFCLSRLGLHDEAVTNYESCLAISRRIFHGDHLNVADVLTHLADTLRAMERRDEALARYTEAMAMEQRLIAAQPNEDAARFSLVRAFGAMGDLLAEMGKNAEGNESYQNGLRVVGAILAGNTNNPKAVELREKLQRSLTP